MKRRIGYITLMLALSACGGGGGSSNVDYWTGSLNTAAPGAWNYTPVFQCGTVFDGQSQCESLDAEKACRTSYKPQPVPTNWTYVCTHTISTH
jgi:hypothetical protein